MRLVRRVRSVDRASEAEQETDAAQALLEFGEVVALVLDDDGMLVQASSRARELFPALEPGRKVPESIELANARRIRYRQGDERRTLIVAPLVDQRSYEELRIGFTAAVSHELRTPLARLLMLLETIERKPEEAPTLSAQARHEVEEMDELLNDVLFLSELESGREVVSLGTTAAVPVLEEVVRELSERADLAGVTLRVEGKRELELPLRPRMLAVVVRNLVTNAIRYAGEGAVCTLSIGKTASGDLELVVADDGAGVGAQHLPRLFERFYRADRARTSRGTGLGLAIVKHVVVSAGGSIGASGAPGEGLTVRCTFPS
jgi:two-component system, OmpR family, phosphate regulon sensor histidine kinase PhoR